MARTSPQQNQQHNQPATTQALYRKYRPSDWSEVIGQDHIVSVLQGALKRGTIFHAYLFAGSRGTGKTTVARIVAREIGAQPADIVEIDAASNRGIDDIRALKESVDTLPFSSPYKVYIIDEVHMLTKEAFNALLKTLEEPPCHVVFILATTERDKIPETITSRCQSFLFRKPNAATLKALVLKTAQAEGVHITPDAADIIALLGDGSFRDTHGTLQKVMHFAIGRTLNAEDVLSLTGAPSQQSVHEVIESIHSGTMDKALRVIAESVRRNDDIRLFTRLLIRAIRVLLLIRVAPDMAQDIEEEIGADQFAFLRELSRSSTRITSTTLSQLLNTYEHMHRSSAPHMNLEVALLQLGGLNGLK